MKQIINLVYLMKQIISLVQSMKQNSMLDLEMADYERTIATLHGQVEERDRRVDDLKSELDKLEQRIALMQTQIGLSIFISLVGNNLHANSGLSIVF